MGADCCEQPKQTEKPSPYDTLVDSKRRLEEKLTQVNAAISFLEANPSFPEGIKLLNLANRF